MTEEELKKREKDFRDAVLHQTRTEKPFMYHGGYKDHTDENGIHHVYDIDDSSMYEGTMIEVTFDPPKYK